jgi:2-amino-4-hydroxy-6-hydroxymethyldihydropteridine diphosphokinase
MTTAYLALGSNLGNREANLRMAVSAITRMCRVTAVSSLYETEPVPVGQPAFYNAAIAIETGLDPVPLLRFLKAIEEEVGRRPGEGAQGPRPIDIDILLYGEAMLESERLVIPHPPMAERPFVLIPLAEIAPDARHPTLGKTVAELAKAAGDKGVRSVKQPGWETVTTSETPAALRRGPAV